MEQSSVRLIPFIFDKLFYNIAPADAIVCQNACQVFDVIAFRQVRYRLSTPKKGMMLLAWPFCMHAGEDASTCYKQVEFYDILRLNASRPAARFRRRNVNVDEEMRKFLAGFESFMLHCVLSNMDLYTELNVLMLDFHAEDFYVCSGDDIKFHAERSQWFKSFVPLKSAARGNVSKKRALFMDAELWSKVINAVVAQCASTLRHFVFRSSLWLPEQFYTSLKLDCMLAQLHQLETLYMPSFEKCEQAYSNSDIQGSCWQALIDLPLEKRLPSLRRVVADHSLNSEDQLVFTDAGNNVGTRFVKLLNSTTLPQFHHLSPKLAIELVVRPVAESVSMRTEKSIRHALPNFAWYAWHEDNLTLSKRTLDGLMWDLDCKNHKRFRDNIPKFIDAVESTVQKVVQQCRPQMLSVIHDVKTGGRGQTATIPACIIFSNLAECAPETAALALNTISRRLSWPLNLTLELDCYYLLKHLSLFTILTTTNKQENDAASSHWTKCFPRGILKLRLKIRGGLQQWAAFEYREEYIKWCLKLRVGNRYQFPLQVTIEFSPIPMKIIFDENDDMPSIREYFIERMREFVNDITDDSPISDEDIDPDTCAAMYVRSKNLRADLYASCQVLIITLKLECGFWRYGFDCSVIKSEDLRRVERLLYDKELEHELLSELQAKLSVEEGERQQVFILPNLKSISFVRDVFD